MSDLVSILIPAYNAEKWIAETIKSALGQTWPAIEIIVVDDGSSDRTVEVVESFKSAKIKVFKQINSGPCVARNTAYGLAQGDVIQWLDADDTIASDKIRSQMLRAAAEGSDRTLLSGPCGTFLQSASNARFKPTAVWKDLTPKELIVRKFTENAHIVIHSWLLTRKLADAAGPWDIRLQKTDADGEYSCRLVRESDRILFVPDAKCYYRKGLPGSLSATRNSLREEELLLELLFGHLLAIEDSDETRDACVAWLKTWAIGYYLVDREAVNIVEKLSKELNRPGVQIPLSIKTRLAETALGWHGAKFARTTVGRTRSLARKYWGAMLTPPLR